MIFLTRFGGTQLASLLVSTKTAVRRIVAASAGCILEADLLRGPFRLSSRDAIPKGFQTSITLVRG
ncbi:hypothetical protein [Bradyrhizobium stylosanthis]|uniref:hypothetical protein n=1 Tax=Bradyrhizobium stylosanthis TaxID=1803665 RepID=UPI0012E825F2|nr:hypothetical protein [Bradyrhizobium stylosanthis]